MQPLALRKQAQLKHLRTIPSLGFFPYGHPDLRVSAVELHAVYRCDEIRIADGEIEALQ